MLNYMDRQTLAQLATTIQAEYRLDDAQYGNLEMGFGFAFAAGAICFGTWPIASACAGFIRPC